MKARGRQRRGRRVPDTVALSLCLSRAMAEIPRRTGIAGGVAFSPQHLVPWLLPSRGFRSGLSHLLREDMIAFSLSKPKLSLSSA